MYGYWDTERDRQNFFSFWINLPPNYQEIKILKKWKKRLEISSFCLCTKNHDHMLCCSWNMACDWCNYFSFWAISYPFTPLKSQKINFSLNKNKKTSRDIILHKLIKNNHHKLDCFWDMVHDGYNYFSFWTIFFPFTPLTARIIKMLKKWKKCWRYHHFTQVYQK